MSRFSFRATLAFLMTLVPSIAMVLAQEPAAGQAGEGGGSTIAYGFMLLITIVVLFIVCLPSRKQVT